MGETLGWDGASTFRMEGNVAKRWKELSSHVDTLRPSNGQMNAAHTTLNSRNAISRMNHAPINPKAVENLTRLGTLRNDLCSVPECKRRHIYWTPYGKFCSLHRDVGMELWRKQGRPLDYTRKGK